MRNRHRMFVHKSTQYVIFNATRSIIFFKTFSDESRHDDHEISTGSRNRESEPNRKKPVPEPKSFERFEIGTEP